MPRMVEPLTGAVFEVAGRNVERRLAKGFRLLEDCEPEPEPAPADEEPEPEERPDETWTVSEIRAWAKDHGVPLPAGGRKADLIAKL